MRVGKRVEVPLEGLHNENNEISSPEPPESEVQMGGQEPTSSNQEGLAPQRWSLMLHLTLGVKVSGRRVRLHQTHMFAPSIPSHPEWTHAFLGRL